MKLFVISRVRLIEISINLLIMVFIITTLIHKLEIYQLNFINQPLLVALGLTISFFIGISMKKEPLINNRIPKTILLICFVFIFILFNSFFIRFHFMFGAVFSLITGVAFGKQLSVNKNSTWIMLIPFWLLSFYIIIQLLGNPNANAVFIRSRNYISFYLIITVLPYYFIKLKNFEYASIIPSIITLLLSVYSLGRSGVIASFVLFIGISLQYFKTMKAKIIAVLSIFLVSILFLWFFIDYFDLFLIIEKFQNIDGMKSIGGRTDFLFNYYNHSDLFGLIFGVDTNTPAILLHGSYLASHIHSSILNFISVAGIFSIVFFYFLYKKMKMFYKYNSTLNFLVIALLLRVATDDGLLFDYFDYTLWMFLLFNFKSIH